MGSYKIEWKRSALKELKNILKPFSKNIFLKIELLRKDPFPSGYKKMIGSQSTYRIREGSYRVIYSVSKETIVIEILKIAHRKDIYR